MADRTFVRLCSTKGSDEKSGNKAFEEMLKAEKVKTEVVQEGGAEDTRKADSDMAAIMEAFAKAQAEAGGAADEFKESEKVVEEVIPEATEKVKEGAVHVEQDFQAETRQLLDIVTNSLCTLTRKSLFVSLFRTQVMRWRSSATCRRLASRFAMVLWIWTSRSLVMRTKAL
jgi:hypothetical protein